MFLVNSAQRGAVSVVDQIKEHLEALPKCGGCEAQSIHRDAIHQLYRKLYPAAQKDIQRFLRNHPANGMIELK